MVTEVKTSPSIEDIILNNDCRGISALRPYLAPHYCTEAAQFILDRRQSTRRTVLITTGFYILSAAAPETDGPPGAIALARALEGLGFEPVFVTDVFGAPLLNLNGQRNPRIIEFPIADHATSRAFAQRLLDWLQPALIISIERCGFASGNRYFNMRGKDISEFTAKVDYLFLGQENTIGIGDGGNEIGMGNYAEKIKLMRSLPLDPARTPVNKLVIASVSNWGGYGLIAALSRLCQTDLLPSVQWEHDLLEELIARGAVDGVTGEKKCSVDSLSAQEHSRVLSQLKIEISQRYPAS
jgi:hypothetical protein